MAGRHTHMTQPTAAHDTQHARLIAHTTRAHATHTAWLTYNMTHAQLRHMHTTHPAWPGRGTQPTDMCTQDTCTADRHRAHGTQHVHSQQCTQHTRTWHVHAHNTWPVSRHHAHATHARLSTDTRPGHAVPPHSCPHPSEPPQRRRLSHTLTQQTDVTLLLEQVQEPARGHQQSDPGMWNPKPWTTSCLSPVPTATMKVRHACTPGPWQVNPSLSVGWAGGSRGRATCLVVGTRFRALLLSWPFAIHSLRIPSWT